MKRHAMRSIPVTTMLAVVLITMGMGQKPPAKPAVEPATKRGAGAAFSRKAQLAAMEGKTRKLDESIMTSWASEQYREYVRITNEVNPGAEVHFYEVDERDVRIGPDSSYAVVVETNYYAMLWDDEAPGLWRGIHFIDGSLYALDTLQRVLWRRVYDSREKPMYGQGLRLTAFSEKYILVEIPDTSSMGDEYASTALLLDNKGKEVRKLLSDNNPKLTSKGKYFAYDIYDENRKCYKDIVLNMYSNDSVVVYGGMVDLWYADEKDEIIVSTIFDGKSTKTMKYLFKEISGRTIDMRREQ
ncbi:MAG: hypothetical protein EG824_11485 [Deltaproteobacteria bacterium]|nr:hypothetical protein [Deltaproteobacteria bacterium]